MAVFRLLYRKRKVLLMLLFMSLFWVIFLYLSMPPAAGFKKKSVDRDKKMSTTRKALVELLPKKKTVTLPNPAKIQDISKKNGKTEPKVQPVLKPVAPIPPYKEKDSSNITSLKTANISSNHSNRGDKNLAEVGNVDKMFNFGAQVKNKTLQKLSDLGLIAKPKPIIKQIDKMSILNITMSQDEFLFVIKTLIKEYDSKISQLQNKTGNLDNSISNQTLHQEKLENVCECVNVNCSCCAQLQLIKFHVSRNACTNFTFVPKSQTLALSFLLDKKVYYTDSISAEHPPKICLGSMSTAVQICVEFYNMSFTVNMHDEHKTQIAGNLNFSFSVYNRTISVFPLGSFKIPSENHKEEAQNQVHRMGNWIP